MGFTIRKVFEMRDILKTIDDENEVCVICLKESCDHDSLRVDGSIGYQILQYWISIAELETKDDWVFLLDGTVIPNFPKGNGTIRGKYSIRPKLDLPLSFVMIKDGTAKLFDDSGMEVKALDLEVKSDGIYWGYYYNDEFYLLHTYRGGDRWINVRQPAFNKVEDFPNNDLVIGFWHVPTENLTHLEFMKGLFYT